MQRELIDTLWNVNLKQYEEEFTYKLELIDTLWNVNGDEIGEDIDATGINRYIMECK